MRKIIRTIFLLILVVSFSCEEQGIFVDCTECTAVEPIKTTLEIKLDLNDYSHSTIIRVYEGNLEDSVLYDSVNAYAVKTSVPVTINKTYTVAVSYYFAGNNYTAIDSATPRVKYNKDQCSVPCYYIYDRTIDLRLRQR